MNFWNPIKTISERIGREAVVRTHKQLAETCRVLARDQAILTASDITHRQIQKIYDDYGNIRTDLIQQVVEAVNKSQVK